MTDDLDTSPNAKEIKARAADWLQRRNFWNWSEDDERALAADVRPTCLAQLTNEAVAR